MRIIIPPTGNEFISMLKTTSLIVRRGRTRPDDGCQQIYKQNNQIIELLIVASIWYMCSPPLRRSCSRDWSGATGPTQFDWYAREPRSAAAQADAAFGRSGCMNESDYDGHRSSRRSRCAWASATSRCCAAWTGRCDPVRCVHHRPVRLREIHFPAHDQRAGADRARQPARRRR